MACKDGLANAPQLFMALFGNDKSTQQNGFTLNGNQLFYIDPVRDFSGSSGRRVSLPAGYAPLHTLPIDTVARRLTWDDLNQRLSLARNISNDQERRIRELFVTRPGFVEPFPESNIKRAVAISEERPPPPPPIPSSPFSSPEQQPIPQATGLRIETNSYLALAAGIVFVAFLSWVFGAASKIMSGDKSKFWRQVGAESISLIASGSVLYWFGIVDEIKLLSIPLIGGFSIALISSIKA